MNDSTLDDECRLLTVLQNSPGIFESIARSNDGELSLQRRLREMYPADVVRAALSLADLRRRAEGKFSRASRMWLTRRGLEQSTGETMAHHKSRRFPVGEVVQDLCCGIGGDTIALASRGPVCAIDCDVANTMRAAANAAVYGVNGSLRTACEDVNDYDVAGSLVHLDPDRRRHRRSRSTRIEEYSPGLESIRRLMRAARGGAVKVSPMADFATAFPGCEIELISVHGECREATVWFGELSEGEARRASVLPAGATLSVAGPVEPVAVSEPREWIFDPDPAVVRAGLVDELASLRGLSRLDEVEEYLTGEEPIDSPFAQGLRIESVHAFDLKALRRTIRQRGIGTLEIKARHVRVDVDMLRRQLRPRGEIRRTLLIARCAGRPRAIIAERVINREAD